MLFNLNNIFYKTDNNKHTASPMTMLFEKYYNNDSSDDDDSEFFDLGDY
jgi:hypothetical protein